MGFVREVISIGSPARERKARAVYRAPDMLQRRPRNWDFAHTACVCKLSFSVGDIGVNHCDVIIYIYIMYACINFDCLSVQQVNKLGIKSLIRVPKAQSMGYPMSPETRNKALSVQRALNKPRLRAGR